MILALDLDDTLYPEETYVYGGFHCVAIYLEKRFGWDRSDSFNVMKDTLIKHGRGSVFNHLLVTKGVLSKSLVNKCVAVYRQHEPQISLFPAAVKLLEYWRGPLYLVTDGHKIVQQRKVEALGIEAYFRRVFITHRFGIRHAKPSTYCFEKIRKLEKCDWGDIIYVGDNPAKDFVNLTPLGVHTVRVLTGQHRNVVAQFGFEASCTISCLDELQVFETNKA